MLNREQKHDLIWSIIGIATVFAVSAYAVNVLLSGVVV